MIELIIIVAAVVVGGAAVFWWLRREARGETSGCRRSCRYGSRPSDCRPPPEAELPPECEKGHE